MRGCGFGADNGANQNRLDAPDIFFVLLQINAAAVPPAPPFPVNQRVDLPRMYTKVCKLNSSSPVAWGVNIYLHFAPFTDNIGLADTARGRLRQLGNAPQVIPLEQTYGGGGPTPRLTVAHFKEGIPSPCYLSTDFGGLVYTEVIAFFGDDVDISDFI